MELEKNIYGLSEGVFKACQFLGLKFPPEAVNNPQPVPSDYFGDDFELDDATIKKLCAERKWKRGQFTKAYTKFKEKFLSQRCFKHTKTDLNVYFCDYVLFVSKQGIDADDYFNFEFYNKSRNLRDGFVTKNYRNKVTVICNDPCSMELENDKAETNILFSEFLCRDWVDTRNCTFEEFKAFVEKHPRFFSKPFTSNQGKGAQIISVGLNEDLEKVFDDLKRRKRLLEEIVTQHEKLSTFCPDTLNTIRFYTILDVHNVVHILATSGRFGKSGSVIDNLHGGGYAVTIDPKTGIIISDAINEIHERVSKHPDTGKTFKGFQYPCWEKVRATVKKMAKMIPQIRHIGWDIAINNKSEATIIEINGKTPAVDLQQAADGVGRRHLYEPLLEEMRKYKWEQMKLLGYKVNNMRNFDSAYNHPSRRNDRLQFAMSKLIPECKSLIDLGCRKEKFVKSITPPPLSKYFPVDYKNYDDEEIIVCDFNEGEFPDIKADACLCAFTAEFVENLPQFLADMCNAAQKQILMLCRPMTEKEITSNYRWSHPFLTDFTADFLIKSMEQNGFELGEQYPMPDNKSIILYDFRRC